MPRKPSTAKTAPLYRLPRLSEPMLADASSPRMRRRGAYEMQPRLANDWVTSPDADLLARLLSVVHPDRIAARIATALLDAMGSLDEVLRSSPAELCAAVPEVCERTAALLVWHRELAERNARRAAEARLRFRTLTDVQDYLHPIMSLLPMETARLLLLNGRNELLADIELARGTANHVIVYPAEVARLALLRRATAVIIAHNHPGGDPAPSEDDVAMTHQIRAALDSVGLIFHDHVVVARSGIFSFRSAGFFNPLGRSTRRM